ncbi:MAG: peroxiredoxin [Nitrospirae bacterium]|nr:MAG: peroxiredoxin [Nitrospirota bacterium]
MIEIGDPMPPFELQDDSGATVRHTDLRGKKTVIFVYPKASTAGCTREAIAFGKHLDAFEKKGVQVLGLSGDSVKAQCRFKEKNGFGERLLSDPERTLLRALGAVAEVTQKGVTKEKIVRSTFVFDEKGKAIRVYPKVKPDGHAEQVLADLD